MASADVLGAPGLPGGAMSYYNPKLGRDSLKRTYTTFANDDLPTECSHFDPDKHLDFEAPERIHTMTELGLSASNAISNVAVSEPFKLFSQEAVLEMRKEIMAEKVVRDYTWQSDHAHNQLRGYAPKEAKFTYDAWKNPETLAIISKIAGVELVPVVDYEIGHINISNPAPKKDHKESELISEEDNKPIVGWHKDSYPFVCVLMMSDTEGMVGGETALRTGSGEIRKVRGPTMGCAVVLQGRYIEHQALAAFGGKERITSVTSFRPKSALFRDDTVLTTVRPISNLCDLYGQVIEYQLENFETRTRRMLKKVRSDMKAGVTDVAAYKKYFEFEMAALAHLEAQIVPVDQVQVGKLAEVCAKQCEEAL